MLSSHKLDEYFRVACYPGEGFVAAAHVTYDGEFFVNLTLLSGGWQVKYNPHRLDLGLDKDEGYCSVAFSKTRAMASDRRGNVLAIEMVTTVSSKTESPKATE